uniref:Uncharacterized protein n=1 Tax=Arundo donax TaxID=35708 RepID=A0A0A9FN95_ARUDO
MMVNLMSPFL